MISEFFSDYTVQLVLAGSAIIGAVSGMIGCLAYLRKQSLVGDVISHSTLLGIVVSFVLTYYIFGYATRSLAVLVPGAIVAGLAALFLSKYITSETRLKQDAGLGLMLAIFFGTGLTGLRWIQKSSNIAGRSGLDDYLFGMAAAITSNDVAILFGMGLVATVALFAFWPYIKAYTCDPEYATGIGLPVRRLEALILTLLVIGIVIGIQVAGVVLMISLLIAPAAAARQWTNVLSQMVLLAAAIGAGCASAGALVSASFKHMPTGPMIVLLLTLVFLVSILFAPQRGVLMRRQSLES